MAEGEAEGVADESDAESSVSFGNTDDIRDSCGRLSDARLGSGAADRLSSCLLASPTCAAAARLTMRHKQRRLPAGERLRILIVGVLFESGKRPGSMCRLARYAAGRGSWDSAHQQHYSSYRVSGLSPPIDSHMHNSDSSDREIYLQGKQGIGAS